MTSDLAHGSLPGSTPTDQSGAQHVWHPDPDPAPWPTALTTAQGEPPVATSMKPDVAPGRLARRTTGRLADTDGDRPSRDMFPQHDEELARSTQVGMLVHRIVAELVTQTRAPSPKMITQAVDSCLSRFRPIEARAHRQNVAGAVGCYFRHLLPPAQFRFYGAELHLGPGRVDLVWADPAGRILVDEIKTGQPGSLRTTRTRDQVGAYRDCGLQVWGEAFLGVRLLCTGSPHSSRFIHADGHAVPLADSDLVGGAQ